MLKISTEIGSIAAFVGEEKAVEYVARAGFDAWDFSMFCMVKYDWRSKKCLPCPHILASDEAFAFAKKLRKIGEEYGIVCNQSHAPFPTACPEIRAQYEKALMLTAEAGGKVCVIHPDNNKSAEENAEIYGTLLDTAKKCGVKIATENMWNWNVEKDIAAPAACSDPKSFVDHINAVNDEYFVACLDIGHAEMAGLGTTAPEMIHALGGSLQALHIHDNDRKNDLHRMPFTCDIDFGAVAKALKEVGYNGYLTLEADRHTSNYKENPEKMFDAVKELADSAKRFAEMVEKA